MISFFKKLLKAKKLKAKSYKLTRGMTYVELIVVLSIFSIISTVSLFNYHKFQEKVEIKSLASDIALKIIEAQRSAISGKMPLPSNLLPSTWRPSYGVYFDLTESTYTGNKVFYYFIDLNDQDKNFDKIYTCPSPTGECLDKLEIKKGNKIKSPITVFKKDTSKILIKKDLHITFKRPNSGAIFYTGGAQITSVDVDYVEIIISSSSLTPVEAKIKIYPSGRIQVE